MSTLDLPTTAALLSGKKTSIDRVIIPHTAPLALIVVEEQTISRRRALTQTGIRRPAKAIIWNRGSDSPLYRFLLLESATVAKAQEMTELVRDVAAATFLMLRIEFSARRNKRQTVVRNPGSTGTRWIQYVLLFSGITRHWFLLRRTKPAIHL
jgi:hypothetical protein